MRFSNVISVYNPRESKIDPYYVRVYNFVHSTSFVSAVVETFTNGKNRTTITTCILRRTDDVARYKIFENYVIKTLVCVCMGVGITRFRLYFMQISYDIFYKLII